MANFPVSLDTTSTLPNPTGTSTQASPDHAALHTTENVAVIAVETKLGTGASTPSSTNLLVSTGTGSSAWTKLAPTGTIVGTSDNQTLTNKVLTSPTINAPTITNASITADAITGFSTSNTGTIYGMSVTTGVLASAAILNSVNTAAIQTNAVTASKLDTSAITLGYTQITSTFTTASTSYVQVTSLTSTVTIPAGGRRVKITVFVSSTFNSNAAIGNSISIWDGAVGSGTQLQQLSLDQNTAGFQVGGTCIAVPPAPSAGSKTYNVGFKTSAGTASFTASATAPAFILVEAI